MKYTLHQIQMLMEQAAKAKLQCDVISARARQNINQLSKVFFEYLHHPRYERYFSDREVLIAFFANAAHETKGFQSLREEMDDKKEKQRLKPREKTDFGRGCLQTTGRDNYTTLQRALETHSIVPGFSGNVVIHPELLESPVLAAVSALEFWRVNGCTDAFCHGAGHKSLHIQRGPGFEATVIKINPRELIAPSFKKQLEGRVSTYERLKRFSVSLNPQTERGKEKTVVSSFSTAARELPESQPQFRAAPKPLIPKVHVTKEQVQEFAQEAVDLLCEASHEVFLERVKLGVSFISNLREAKMKGEAYPYTAAMVGTLADKLNPVPAHTVHAVGELFSQAGYRLQQESGAIGTDDLVPDAGDLQVLGGALQWVADQACKINDIAKFYGSAYAHQVRSDISESAKRVSDRFLAPFYFLYEAGKNLEKYANGFEQWPRIAPDTVRMINEMEQRFFNPLARFPECRFNPRTELEYRRDQAALIRLMGKFLMSPVSFLENVSTRARDFRDFIDEALFDIPRVHYDGAIPFYLSSEENLVRFPIPRPVIPLLIPEERDVGVNALDPSFKRFLPERLTLPSVERRPSTLERFDASRPAKLLYLAAHRAEMHRPSTPLSTALDSESIFRAGMRGGDGKALIGNPVHSQDAPRRVMFQSQNILDYLERTRLSRSMSEPWHHPDQGVIHCGSSGGVAGPTIGDGNTSISMQATPQGGVRFGAQTNNPYYAAIAAGVTFLAWLGLSRSKKTEEQQSTTHHESVVDEHAMPMYGYRPLSRREEILCQSTGMHEYATSRPILQKAYQAYLEYKKPQDIWKLWKIREKIWDKCTLEERECISKMMHNLQSMQNGYNRNDIGCCSFEADRITHHLLPLVAWEEQYEKDSCPISPWHKLIDTNYDYEAEREAKYRMAESLPKKGQIDTELAVTEKQFGQAVHALDRTRESERRVKEIHQANPQSQINIENILTFMDETDRLSKSSNPIDQAIAAMRTNICNDQQFYPVALAEAIDRHNYEPMFSLSQRVQTFSTACEKVDDSQIIEHGRLLIEIAKRLNVPLAERALLYDVGCAYARKSNYLESIKFLKDTLHCDANNPDAHFVLGNIQMRSDAAPEERQEGFQHLVEAKRLKPEMRHVYSLLMQEKMKEGKIEEALGLGKEYRRLFYKDTMNEADQKAFSADMGVISFLEGSAYEQQQQYPQAVQSYSETLTYDSQNIEARLALANLYSRGEAIPEDRQKIIPLCKEVLQIQPDDKRAYMFLMQEEFNEENYDHAEEVAHTYQEKFGEDEPLSCFRAQVAQRRNEFVNDVLSAAANGLQSTARMLVGFRYHDAVRERAREARMAIATASDGLPAPQPDIQRRFGASPSVPPSMFRQRMVRGVSSAPQPDIQVGPSAIGFAVTGSVGKTMRQLSKESHGLFM